MSRKSTSSIRGVRWWTARLRNSRGSPWYYIILFMINLIVLVMLGLLQSSQDMVRNRVLGMVSSGLMNTSLGAFDKQQGGQDQQPSSSGTL